MESFNRKEGHVHKEIIDLERTQKMIEIGKKHGVLVTVIAESGADYTTDGGYQGKVPEGQQFVSVDSEKANLHDFWDAVNKTE